MNRTYRHAIVSHAVAKRRRLVVAATSLVTTKHVTHHSRGPSIPRSIFSFSLHIQGLSDAFFERLYRMSKECFFTLANKISLERGRSGLRFSKTSPMLRLSVTLRWLAGGSYLDISLAHGLHPSSVYFHIDNTLRDIDKCLTITFPYNDEQWLKSSSEGFRRSARSPLQNCCAALDGLAIKITEPPTTEVSNTSSYNNRKGFFALNLQAACDHRYRFVFASGIAAGSTHDSTAFAMSTLATLLERDIDGLIEGFWIACDEAYCEGKNMLCPWPDRKLSVDKDCFNYWLSSARIHIEQCFGILVGRWGILWRPLRLSVAKSASLVITLRKLHNYIIDMCDTVNVPAPSGIDNTYHTVPPDRTVELQDECDTDTARHRRRRDLETCNLRTLFMEEIKAAGLRRPV